jgi:isoleucyl-tRNA synthetase
MHSRAQEWETTVRRVGRWIDFENDYKTLDPEFMARARCVMFAHACVRAACVVAPRRAPCDAEPLRVRAQESVWWVFKTLHEKGLVYRGFKARRTASARTHTHPRIHMCAHTLAPRLQVMPYSTACNTPLSNFESGLDYRDVSDPAIMARRTRTRTRTRLRSRSCAHPSLRRVRACS